MPDSHEMDASRRQSGGRPVRPGFAEDVYGTGRSDSSPGSSSSGTSNSSAAEMCGSALAQRRSANLPKLKELCAGGSSELNISSMECPLASARANQMAELDFQYADCDSHKAELAELYTYSEMDEFALNYDCFGRYMRERKKEPMWSELSAREKCKLLQELVERLENAEPEQRLEAARIILYILQGAYGDFAELESKDSDQWSTEASRNDAEGGEGPNGGNGLDVADKWFGQDHGTGGYEQDCLVQGALNAYFVYEQGLFQPICTLLRLESSIPFVCHADHSRQSSVSNSRSASHMDLASGSGCESVGAPGSASGTLERRRSKRSATLADNERIRVALSCIYHMVESIHRNELIDRIVAASANMFHLSVDSHHSHHQNRLTSKYSAERLHSLRRQFLTELEEPMEQGKEPLLVQLFEMMPSFVRGKNPHFPIKKILLLCWKVLLATLGGMQWLREEKARRRANKGLAPIEDTLQFAVKMKPVLNCSGGGGLLGLGGMGGGGKQQMDGDQGNRQLQLGRKVRSIHASRPLNRQVACSSAQDTPAAVGSHRVRSNAFSDDGDEYGKAPFDEEYGAADPGNFEDVANQRSKSRETFEEEVDEAIVGAEEEESEEAEPTAEEEGANALLDQVLEELSAAAEDGVAPEGHEEARKCDSKEGGDETPQPHTEDARGPISGIGTTTVQQQPPKITFSQSKEDQSSGESGAVEEVRKKLILINIDRRASPKAANAAASSGDGGDQTPKACQSPVSGQMDPPWPPPPPPGLPWRPKVREGDVEQFLQVERQKYFGFQLPSDAINCVTFGLPDPVVNGSIAALRRNLYTPLSDLQLKSEERYDKYPFSQREFIEDSPGERLYVRILPSMTEYVIALLKVILASLPSSKAKIDAVTILSDVLTPETDTNEMLSNSISLDLSNFANSNVLEETVRVAIDINRHKELIVKGASAIIILLLKHLRLNHVYQFENFAQYLVLANCLPLVLKFLDQNICRYFQSKHELAPFNYPQCALHFVRNGSEWPQLTADNIDERGAVSSESPSYFLWRNVFSSINLLRVINKLTKGKQARTMMLVVYKSAPVLKRCMRAKLGIFQLYVLKLLKMQARYLGRQWRKTNMELISAIYMRVRHRLNDDWAYANEITRTKSFDFQREENDLGMAIKRFNARRYPHLIKEREQRQGTAAGAEEGEEHHQQEERNSPVAGGRSDGGAKTGIVDDWDAKDWEPLDNVGPLGNCSLHTMGVPPFPFQSLQTALAWEPQFSQRFTQDYRRWLDEEVFNGQTDWDSLLRNSRGLLDIYC